MISKFLVALAFLTPAAHAVGLGEPLESIPVQDGGRVKPFSTFARETLQLIHGKSKFEDKTATEVVMTWLLIPDHWLTTPLVEVRHSGLREALKITEGKEVIRFSAQDLFTNERIPLVIQGLNTVRSRQEKLNPYFQAVQRLESQLALFQAIRSGQAIRIVPNPENDTWKSVAELEGELREAFGAVTKGFVDSIALGAGGGKVQANDELIKASAAFVEKARAVAPEKYADMNKISWEQHLDKFHPFKWAWICYLITFLLLLINQVSNVRGTAAGSWIFLIAGFALHTYGMVLRMYLAGRPPVSNMYETVVWVPYGALIFAVILERVQKNKLLLMAATAVSVGCLILTDLAPTVLDKSIQPLEPVLRSTFWLSTHVLIITISYAAFFLAFAVGDVLLFYYLKDEKKYAAQIQGGVQGIYRSIQIGCVLLAAGTILGGIWADYSWGRFWGWDPKETWALISLLGYIALLHGRLAGWIKNFEMAAGAVVAFSLIIMAWYGVNYVLGAGLHSYGFGAGGVEYVSAFVGLHVLYVVYVSTVRYGRLKKTTS
jgi:ABC-type transport system involved in cytochrome c biogenesis permease subunit